MASPRQAAAGPVCSIAHTKVYTLEYAKRGFILQRVVDFILNPAVRIEGFDFERIAPLIDLPDGCRRRLDFRVSKVIAR